MRRAERRAELARLRAEVEDARPFVALAREIHEEVRRLAAEGADGEAVAEAVEAVPRAQRVAMARAVFDRLAADQQWAVLDRVFGDEDIREALAAERAVRMARAARSLARREVLDGIGAHARLDTRTVPVGESLTLGLFREVDVLGALARGSASGSCAREVVLRAVDDTGTFQVLADVFNPGGGLFVTGDYDEEVWRQDRLPAHARVRVGSVRPAITGGPFEPVLYPAGRVDVELAREVVAGRLHMGYVRIGEDEVAFGGDSTT